MRNNLVVFCNIEDGFEDIITKDNERNIKKFINILEQKRIENGCRMLTICLISKNEDGNYLKEYYDYLKKFTDNYRTKIGISYFKRGGIIGGNIKEFGEDNDLFEFIDCASSSQMYSTLEPVTSVLFIGSKESNNSISEHYTNNPMKKNENASYEYCTVNVSKETGVCFKDAINSLNKSVKYNIYNFKNDDKKENILLFFSDIDGTIDKLDENYAKDLKEALEAKKVATGADKVVLNLISNCTNSEYLKLYANMLKEMLSTDSIIVGEHFYKGGVLIEDNIFYEKDPETNLNIPSGEFKADKIIYLINKFSKKYNIKHICYADDIFDTECYVLLTSLIDETNFNIEFYSSVFFSRPLLQDNFITFNGNIWGLIESIRKSTHNFTDKDKVNINDISYKIGEKPVSNNE